MSGRRRKTTLTQIKMAIVICITLIALSFWRLQHAVSQLETRLIEQEPLAEYARDIGRFHYFVAVGFLALGILLGLGIGAYKLTKDRSQQ